MMKRRAFSPAPVLALILIACTLLGVAITMTIRSWRAPLVTIPPPPPMPSPNAFDDFTKAGRVVPDEVDPRKMTKTEKAALAVKIHPAIAMLESGLSKEYRCPPQRSFEQPTPYHWTYRNMARGLRAAAEASADSGDWAGSMRYALLTIRFGSKMSQGEPVSGDLESVALQGIGRMPAWKAVEHLSAAQAHESTTSLQQAIADQQPLPDTLQEEEWYCLAGVQEAITKEVSAPDGEPFSSEELRSLSHYPKPLLRIWIRQYRDYMHACIANARKLYPARKPYLGPRGKIANILVVDQAKFEWKITQNQAENALLLVSLALRAYYVEHHHYPVTLAALTPAYLPAIPDDPFAMQGPLRYVARDTSCTLYSIGPDGKDNGGNGSDLVKGQIARDDSTGDIVVNMGK